MAETRQLGFCQHHPEVGWQPAAALKSGLASSTLCSVSRAQPGGAPWKAADLLRMRVLRKIKIEHREYCLTFVCGGASN